LIKNRNLSRSFLVNEACHGHGRFFFQRLFPNQNETKHNLDTSSSLFSIQFPKFELLLLSSTMRFYISMLRSLLLHNGHAPEEINEQLRNLLHAGVANFHTLIQNIPRLRAHGFDTIRHDFQDSLASIAAEFDTMEIEMEMEGNPFAANLDRNIHLPMGEFTIRDRPAVIRDPPAVEANNNNDVANNNNNDDANNNNNNNDEDPAVEGNNNEAPAAANYGIMLADVAYDNMARFLNSHHLDEYEGREESFEFVEPSLNGTYCRVVYKTRVLVHSGFVMFSGQLIALTEEVEANWPDLDWRRAFFNTIIAHSTNTDLIPNIETMTCCACGQAMDRTTSRSGVITREGNYFAPSCVRMRFDILSLCDKVDCEGRGRVRRAMLALREENNTW